MLRLPNATDCGREASLAITLDDLALVQTDWKAGLPTIDAGGVTIRELRISDAPALLAYLTTPDVARFISPPPTDVAGFERFIAWQADQRSKGTYFCFAIVAPGCEHAAGIVQVRALDSKFRSAEWGFALGTPFWGTGVFMAAARAVLNFVFTVVGVQRVEARSCVENSRGNRVLEKLGAAKEGLLRHAFEGKEGVHDQFLWAITAVDRVFEKAVWSAPTIH
jgi:[ribosomal protein S5]-alanine N-acetyltransferase